MILILISKIICTFFHFSDVGMMEKCYCASGKHVPKSITCPAWEWKPLKKPLLLKKSGIAPGIFVFNVARQLYHTVFIVPVPIARLMILFWRNTKVVYMSSSFWLLALGSRDLSQAKKEITACKAEQINKMITTYFQSKWS